MALVGGRKHRAERDLLVAVRGVDVELVVVDSDLLVGVCRHAHKELPVEILTTLSHNISIFWRFHDIRKIRFFQKQKDNSQ